MIVAGWAWGDRLLAETVSRSAQADMVILLFVLGCIGLLFAALAWVADVLDRRALRRDISRAHQPRPVRPGTGRGVSGFLCTSEDMHPYECDGRGKCRHCDRRFIRDVNNAGGHDPATCALCDPEYDHQSNVQWGAA